MRVYTHLSGIFASRLTVQHVGKEGVALTLKPTRLSRVSASSNGAWTSSWPAIGLIVASPILLVVALAVKSTSRGPVLFRQERVTEGARTFLMYKFRTMTDGAEHGTEEDAVDTSAAVLQAEERSSSDEGRQGCAGGASTSFRSCSTCSWAT